MKIVIIGGGSWGTALAKLLCENKNEVIVWTNQEEDARTVNTTNRNEKYLPGVDLPKELLFSTDKNVIRDGEVIVSALPSKVTGGFYRENKELFNENQIIVNVAKGFDPENQTRLSVAIANAVPSKVCVLSGPSHAEEVANKQLTVLTVACEDKSVAELVQKLFSNDYIRVYTNKDVIGVELGGATKNIIALAAGVIDGMGYGDNTKAALMTRGMHEITKLGIILGANVNTFYGLTGMGDLIVTCGSMHSRNRRAGILLGQGKTLDETLAEIGMVVEGVEAVKIVYQLSKKLDVEMPLTEALYSGLFEDKQPKDLLLNLMSRDMKSENLFK